MSGVRADNLISDRNGKGHISIFATQSMETIPAGYGKHGGPKIHLQAGGSFQFPVKIRAEFRNAFGRRLAAGPIEHANTFLLQNVQGFFRDCRPCRQQQQDDP